MMLGSRCSPSPNRVTAQIGGEFANSNVNTAVDIMAMLHYASLTQPTPPTPAFYARCMKIFRHLYGIGALVHSTGLTLERVQRILLGFTANLTALTDF